jgi:hypothetical protein
MSLFTTRSRLALEPKKSSAQEDKEEEEEKEDKEATTPPKLHNFHLFLSLHTFQYPNFQRGTIWASWKAMEIYVTTLCANLTIPYKGLVSNTGLQIYENTDNCFTAY